MWALGAASFIADVYIKGGGPCVAAMPEEKEQWDESMTSDSVTRKSALRKPSAREALRNSPSMNSPPLKKDRLSSTLEESLPPLPGSAGSSSVLGGGVAVGALWLPS